MSAYITTFVGLGSNLNSPSQQINAGLHGLATIEGCKNLLCAKWYSSKAVGPGEQPDYINTVAKLDTTLSPHELLAQLHIIENRQGRQRTVPWGARTLDLDLLLYDNIQLNDDRLTLPHPEIRHRAFVLLPLYDLAASLVLPTGEVLEDLIRHCDTSDLQLIEPKFPR